MKRYYRSRRQSPERRTVQHRPVFDPPAPTGSDNAAADGSVKTGTTTVGLKTRDGVVIATDMRASIHGSFIANKNVQKVEQVHPKAAMTLVGSVGEAQWFVRTLRSEANLYELRMDEPLSVEGLQQLAVSVVRRAPIQNIMPILGGVDETGHHVASIGPSGSIIGEEYVSTGSGMQLAYGYLEQNYSSDISNEEACQIAAKAVKSASSRDAASGNGIFLAQIRDEGVDISGYKDFDTLLTAE